jgi:hypothetical protein
MKYFCLLPILLLWGCNRAPETLFTSLPGSVTGVRFSNTVAENDSFNLVDYYYVYNGGGVAVGDLNNDNLPDLYLRATRSATGCTSTKARCNSKTLPKAPASGKAAGLPA